MFQNRTLGWWYWLATVGLLAAGFAGWEMALPLTIALCGVQIVHYLVLERSVVAFPVQVRVAFLILLLIGLYEPLRPVHWIQLAGTLAKIVFDYCLLDRLLSLLPRNRPEPLSVGLVLRTIFSRPVYNSIQQ